MATEQVGTHEAKTRLSEYVNRVHYRGDRIVIERHGKPVAALVSVEDLARLEESSSGSVEQRYRKALEKAGIEISYPDPDKQIPRKRHLIKLEGKPLSEQIIEDRR
ncbi:MAG TPA: type II toxin-antitoxin system Phd/YefM family antitoxin [Rubrobacteraceae bacterium]|jgi:prevent-host-death family protein|nr:type II toxin-antitoxin system Phd/YefM family antitoxin [Rubrobacteraceae bacterium]HLL57550.1 type II toxin-antitoxin system Phd/YefM family antitoxin [Rubrobacteraceae bacterium]